MHPVLSMASSLSGSVLSRLVTAFAEHPELATAITFDQLLLFYTLIQCCKEHLSWTVMARDHGPPKELPRNVLCFLSSALGLDDNPKGQPVLCSMWQTLNVFIWESTPSLHSDPVGYRSFISGLRSRRLFDIFVEHGIQHDICASNTLLDTYTR